MQLRGGQIAFTSKSEVFDELKAMMEKVEQQYNEHSSNLDLATRFKALMGGNRRKFFTNFKFF